MRSSFLLTAVALGALAGTASADFLLTAGNAAFNPSFTNPAWGASLSNTTRPYQWNTSANVTGAEANLFTDAPGAFTATSLGSSPLRSYRWGFRNAGGANGGTAGKGLSGTAGGLSSYTQTFSAGSNTGKIDWVDVFETNRSRIDASITSTQTHGGAPNQALVRAHANFTNQPATTETYDFFNLVDSQILGRQRCQRRRLGQRFGLGQHHHVLRHGQQRQLRGQLHRHGRLELGSEHPREHQHQDLFRERQRPDELPGRGRFDGQRAQRHRRSLRRVPVAGDPRPGAASR